MYVQQQRNSTAKVLGAVAVIGHTHTAATGISIIYLECRINRNGRKNDCRAPLLRKREGPSVRPSVRGRGARQDTRVLRAFQLNSRFRIILYIYTVGIKKKKKKYKKKEERGDANCENLSAVIPRANYRSNVGRLS